MRVELPQIAAVNVGKEVRRLTRALGRGGGTSLPGLLAERIDPRLVSTLSAELPNGCVVVTGTNGKTTTTRILAEAVRRFGWSALSNREGANLLRGVATVLLDHADRAGRLRVPRDGIGVFEIDEGTLPAAVTALRPRLVVITNLFRDQLDRYFEVDFVARLWARALADLPAGATLVLNADDPQVAFLGEAARGKVVYFGLDDLNHAHAGLEHAADSRRCLRCGVDLLYVRTFYAHLGHYACGHCGWRRPDADVAARHIELSVLEGGELEVTTPGGDQLLHVPLAGLYNIYNALAAVAGATALGVAPEVVATAVGDAGGAFGRLEWFDVLDKHACLLLVKNPSGFNQALRLLLGEHDGEPKRLLLALNDNGPDGRDVSWIWDVDLERCANGRAALIVAAGERAWDLALRLKYAGVGTNDAEGGGVGAGALVVEEDVVQAFWRALTRTPTGGTLYVLPTYTAMWTLREHLVREGYLESFWRHREQPAGSA
jgi:UDP-N-acetylmuramyl tripeptide synthase